jgi:hypothetical protein
MEEGVVGGFAGIETEHEKRNGVLQIDVDNYDEEVSSRR